MPAENDIFLNLDGLDPESPGFIPCLIDNFLQLKIAIEKQDEDNTTFQATTDGTVLNNLTALAAPTADDDSGDGYSRDSIWADTTNNKVYICNNPALGAAIWEKLADLIHDNVNGEIAALTEKASPVSADLLLIEDSAASNAKKKVQITNLPTGSDSDAIHDNVASEISAVTEKGTPVDADMAIIEDSADSNNKKMIQLGNLPSAYSSGSGTVTTATHQDAYDVSGATNLFIIYCNTASNDIRFGGLSGGTDKMVVIWVKTSSANDLYIENDEGSGTEKIITDTGADISFASYGGCTAVFNGTNWKVFAKT